EDCLHFSLCCRVTQAWLFLESQEEWVCFSDRCAVLYCPVLFLGGRGLQGSKGNPGPPGLSVPGIYGRPGEPGLIGLQGNMGLPGPKGQSGRPGISGAPGFPGLPGLSTPSVKGSKGVRGADGIPGPRGPAGDIGPPGPKVSDRSIACFLLIPSFRSTGFFFFKFLVCNFLGCSVLQNNKNNDEIISNMLKSRANNCSCSIFCEHNAFNILNKNKMYFIVWRCCSCSLLMFSDFQGIEGRSGYPGARGEPGFLGFPGVKGIRIFFVYSCVSVIHMLSYNSISV
uniref:Uncharacterized protein n=1 Tax=Malurus cyaneus samueli TaxID=2593467 RepID=A0A8C5U6L7_9PASS